MVLIMNYKNIVTYNSSFVKSFYGTTTQNAFAGDIASVETAFAVAGGATFSATENDYFSICLERQLMANMLKILV